MAMIFDTTVHELLDPLQAAVASRDRDVPLMVTRALAEGRTQLAFQPVVRAGGEPVVAFHEALIRVLDEGGRILPAGQFLPDVEDSSLGRDLDCESLRLSIAMLVRHPALRLAVNMSARSIADGRWRQTLMEGLQRTEIGPRLILEISEQSAMLIPEVVIRFMAEVQPRGVAFALDDFGAGLTAFRYLKDFFFDLAKIDSHFVRDIDSNPDNQVLAEALITVAHQFEMFAVAEGVERPEEARMLESLGADCLQGYLFGVPRPTL